MKLPFPTKTLLLFAASFVVINIAMYFVMKMTEPKSAAVPLARKVKSADSTAHSSTPTTTEIKKDTTQSPTMNLAAATPDTNARTPMESPNGTPPTAAPTGEANTSPGNTNETSESVAESDTSGTSDMGAITNEENAPEDQATALNKATTEDDAKRLQRLAKLLESMKPQQAAPIVSRLSDETIVALFMHMHERPAAKIMALLPVEQAARVSFLMTRLAEAG